MSIIERYQEYKERQIMKSFRDYHANLPELLADHEPLREYLPKLIDLCNQKSDLYFNCDNITGTDEIVFAKLIFGRDQDFFEGIILCLWRNNVHAVFPLMRALVEDLFLLKYVEIFPAYIKEYLNSPVNTETKLALFKSKNQDKKLKDFYAALCNKSHPNPDAIRFNLYPGPVDNPEIEKAILIENPFSNFHVETVQALTWIYSEQIRIVKKFYQENMDMTNNKM